MAGPKETRAKLLVVSALVVGMAAAAWLARRGAPAADTAGMDADASDADLGERGVPAAAADAGAEHDAYDDTARDGDADAPGDADAAAEAACPQYAYDDAMRRARALSAKDHASAARAFDEAVRARPYDARARAERAFEEILAATGAEAGSAAYWEAASELTLARALTRDKALLAQIEWNTALAEERRGDAVQARRALVRAAGLGSAEAKKRLGAESRCLAEVGASGDDLKLLPRWTDVMAAVAEGSTCPAAVAANEVEARALSCGSCSGANGTWAPGVCAGPGPWTINAGYMHCSAFSAVIQPVGARFYVASGPGPQTALARAPGDKAWLLRGVERNFLWIAGHFPDADATYRQGEGWTDTLAAGFAAGRCLADEHADAPLEPSAGCQASSGASYEDKEERSYYDDAGHLLARVVLYDQGGEKPVVRLDDAGVKVTGAGCQLTVPLAKPNDAGTDAAGPLLR